MTLLLAIHLLDVILVPVSKFWDELLLGPMTRNDEKPFFGSMAPLGSENPVLRRASRQGWASRSVHIEAYRTLLSSGSPSVPDY